MLQQNIATIRSFLRGELVVQREREGAVITYHMVTVLLLLVDCFYIALKQAHCARI